jgi:thioredoxin-related protein
MPMCRALVVVSVIVGMTASGGVTADPPLIWHTNYNSARKLAQDTGRPLLVQLGTEQCVYCRKMEATTFRDAQVQAVLRDYVLLKVDGNQEAALTQMLKVTLYPTTVLAGADGTIHTYVAGYVGVEKFLDPLVRTRELVVAETKLTTDFATASAATKRGEYAKAIPSLQRLALVAKGKPLEKQANDLLDEIERSADARALLVERLPADEQRAAWVSVASLFPGTVAATRAEQRAQSLSANARILTPIRAASVLTAARELQKAGEYAGALTMCDTLSRTDEAVAAKQLADEIRSDAKKLAIATRQSAEKLAALQFTLAEAAEAQGDTANAVKGYELAWQLAPQSPKATLIQAQLMKLRSKTLEATPAVRAKN